jgi:hypothetical protein
MQALLLRETEPTSDQVRVYSLCLFNTGEVVPTVALIDAATDAEAIAIGSASQQFKRREIWDRHRLVAVIPAVH